MTPASDLSTADRKLTKRQSEVLGLMDLGYSNADISDRLRISVNTVKDRVCEVYTRLGIRGRFKVLSRSKQPASGVGMAKEEPPINLTTRKLEVLTYAAKGFGGAESGRLLGISKKTVEIHLADARYALEASNTTEACCIAIRKGIIA